MAHELSSTDELIAVARRARHEALQSVVESREMHARIHRDVARVDQFRETAGHRDRALKE
jgi:hypothetical protein